MKQQLLKAGIAGVVCGTSFLMLVLSPSAQASIAYGSLNNFDCVNDTGFDAHGFDIELDDVRSKDITYTYDWNHYGVPRIIEDTTSVPGHTNVLIRYAAVKTNGVWSAYTAIPSGPIAPTQGHQFTDPSVNFGGEHFGVGYYGAPSAVKYNWLIDDGTGNLVHGPPVNVATPTFTYFPPPLPAAPPQVQAAIVPPPPPVPPVLQFGDASWVKEIKTTTHNAKKVQLVQLVGNDPGQPQPWANGEPAEVEVEWRILQTDFAAANGGAKGELKGAPEDLPGGDEFITRRYEFFKYIGPIDAESGEAMADAVGALDADGVHYFGTGTVTYNDHFDRISGEWVTATVDLSTVWVVGEFFGAQMSGFDVAPNLGLIDHIQDGEVNVPYGDRTVVVAGGAPFLASLQSGSLPDGMTLDALTGVLSGTPTVAGMFTFTVGAADTAGALISKAYTVTITGGVVPPTFTIATSASPAIGGGTAGSGSYLSGQSVTVTATPNAGHAFVNWTEGGVAVSASASYQFILNANRTLVANFTPITHTVATSASPSAGGTTAGNGTYASGSRVTVTATPNAGYAFANWTEGGAAVSASASYQFILNANRTLVANFTPITYMVATSASPSAGGTTAGNGTYASGSRVTVTATPNAGYAFANWTEASAPVSVSASFQFALLANHSLVANFTPITYAVTTSASPSAGGATTGAGDYGIGSSVTVTATPNAGYAFVNWTEAGVAVSGSASYQFAINVDRTLVANFTVIPNQPPVANPDSVTTAEDAPLTINPATLLGNDTDPEGDSLTIVSAQDASGGTVALAGGDVVFTPSLNFNGAASFTYTISDGNGGTATGTVSLTVTPVNLAPVAKAGPDQTVLLHDLVRLNGTRSSDVDRDPLTYRWSLLTKPAQSKAALSGAMSANPTLRPDRRGTYEISLIVNDGTVDSTADIVTIAVTKDK